MKFKVKGPSRSDKSSRLSEERMDCPAPVWADPQLATQLTKLTQPLPSPCESDTVKVASHKYHLKTSHLSILLHF